jgi:hypothetical protein
MGCDLGGPVAAYAFRRATGLRPSEVGSRRSGARAAPPPAEQGGCAWIATPGGRFPVAPGNTDITCSARLEPPPFSG